MWLACSRALTNSRARWFGSVCAICHPKRRRSSWLITSTNAGVAGNEADYHDRKNSLLPTSSIAALGIPITLGLVYCEIARRVGYPARGVSFPGHFFGPHRQEGLRRAPVVVDPFFGGRMLDEKALVALLKRVVGPRETLRAEHLEPASPRLILVSAHAHQFEGRLPGAGRKFTRALGPRSSGIAHARCPLRAARTRAACARLGSYEVARTDLTRFLQLSPAADDAKAIKARLESLDGTRHWLN